jgi:hypothetical protein
MSPFLAKYFANSRHCTGVFSLSLCMQSSHKAIQIPVLTVQSDMDLQKYAQLQVS